VCERRVDLLVCSLPWHRHSYIGFILAFASSIHNKQQVFCLLSSIFFSLPPASLSCLYLSLSRFIINNYLVFVSSVFFSPSARVSTPLIRLLHQLQLKTHTRENCRCTNIKIDGVHLLHTISGQDLKDSCKTDLSRVDPSSLAFSLSSHRRSYKSSIWLSLHHLIINK
jgi:hypothetical protein